MFYKVLKSNAVTLKKKILVFFSFEKAFYDHSAK